ncbi:GAF domain-containing protein [Candidatus Bathyarchaeota archaeon]|nr:GAF domain-containing protein [Candidatus Bathyarchaeota archaeon]
MEISDIPEVLINQIPISVSIHVDNKVVYANNKCLEISGYPNMEAIQGVSFTQHIQSEHREKIRKKLAEGKNQINNIKIIDNNGKTRYLNISIMKATWHGEPATIQFSFDITDQTLLRKNLEETQNRLLAIHRYTVKIREAYTIDEVAEKMLETILELLDTEICSISLVRGNQLDFKYQSTESWINTLNLDTPSVTTIAAKTGKTQRISDITQESIYVDWTDRKIRSELAVPIKQGQETVGVINIESETTDRYTEEDQKLVEILADYFASELEKIEYVKQVEQLERNRSKELLEGINRVTKMVKHDLRGPMSVIKNSAYLMKTNQGNNEELTEQINESINRINTIINDIGKQTLTGDLTKVPKDIIALTKNIMSTCIIPKKIEVKTEYSQEILYVNLDAAKYRRAIDNLVNNAVESMPDGGKLYLKVSTNDNQVITRIKDTGVGIPLEEQEKIFQPYYTTKNTGMGLGLSIVKQIIEAHEGTISIDSIIGKGTEFTIKIPLS